MNTDRRFMIGTDCAGIDVDMNQFLRWNSTVAASADFGETGADGEHYIAFLECVLGGRHGRRSKAHASMQRMITGKCGEALQRGGNGCPQVFCDSNEVI